MDGITGKSSLADEFEKQSLQNVTYYLDINDEKEWPENDFPFSIACSTVTK